MKRVTIHATICRFPPILWNEKNDMHGLFCSLCRLECGMEYLVVPLGDIELQDGEKLLRNVMRQSYVTCAKKRVYLFEDIKVDAVLNAVLIKPSEAFRAYATALSDKVDLKLLAKCVMREGK